MSRNFFCDTFALKIDYASLIKQPAISYNLGKDEFMETIELYKDKINSMSNYIEQAKNAVSDFCVDLSALKSKILGINSSVCDNVVSSISSSSQTQEQQIAGLEATQKEVNAFIDLTINRDNSAADAVSKAKDEFYKEYSYLKPECEKSDWEKFCDGLKKVGDWCKDHWKLIVTIAIVVAAIVLLVSGVGTGLGAAILTGACWGAISGAVIGGISGGIMSKLNGGAFFEGFENGAFDGAIGGAIGGAITGGLTFAIGPSSTIWGSIVRSAGIEAGASGTSNMCVTTIDYLAENGTLTGSLDDIFISGLSGVISGSISGGITGGFIHCKSQLKVSNSKYLTQDGKIDWDTYAPNNGRVEGSVLENQKIKQGTIIDRYGSKYGKYTSPIGISFEARALPYDNNSWAYHKYMVIQDIDGVTSSEIAAAFDQPGGGIQFELPGSVKELMEKGFLKEIFF